MSRVISGYIQLNKYKPGQLVRVACKDSGDIIRDEIGIYECLGEDTDLNDPEGYHWVTFIKESFNVPLGSFPVRKKNIFVRDSWNECLPSNYELNSNSSPLVGYSYAKHREIMRKHSIHHIPTGDC